MRRRIMQRLIWIYAVLFAKAFFPDARHKWCEPGLPVRDRVMSLMHLSLTHLRGEIGISRTMLHLVNSHEVMTCEPLLSGMQQAAKPSTGTDSQFVLDDSAHIDNGHDNGQANDDDDDKDNVDDNDNYYYYNNDDGDDDDANDDQSDDHDANHNYNDDDNVDDDDEITIKVDMMTCH
ncbi:hypothetical protein DPMN_040882 [Dreissena polymorpha]|uniref:Uncharacterized protein n=1 Tax=Dreissena polymorpha TaxID=45954 RepID=A0A9D4CXR1_DREPO|nr:hypothetical protein DPMN_040882 [Dreissena polymorpha]